MRRAGWLAAAIVIGWYLLTLAIAWPLSNGPVVDGWIYAQAARFLAHAGRIRFPGYTSAMPVGQVAFGAVWGSLFGLNFASLQLSVALLGIVAALLFFALAIRCGAGTLGALLGTALLIANPCWLFLSFSFMTEIPFLVLSIGAMLAFARAEGPRESAWLWACAALIAADFTIRPFAGAIAGGAGAAILLEQVDPSGERPIDYRRLLKLLLPLAVAVAVCAALWYWLTVSRPVPWDLHNREVQLKYFFYVPLGSYVLSGVLGPALTLGAVLAPVAILQWRRARLGDAAAMAAVLFAATFILVRQHPSSPEPQFSCFGGWTDVLQLRGPTRFFWRAGDRWLAVAAGSIGAAGLYVAALDTFARLSRAAVAVMIAAALYWLGMLPLWLFNDRYDLVLLPAGCLLLALAPMPRSRAALGAAIALTLALGWVAIAGVYDYQRGIAAVMAARNDLLRAGVKRRFIDAGYALNGEDLYRYPRVGTDTLRLEAGIPMITSSAEDEYTITLDPIPGTTVVRRYHWPGPLGFGRRTIYVVKKVRALRRHMEPAAARRAPAIARRS
jgi:hypothetical protein